MKLLLDENLSRRIVEPLQAHFPGSSHVSLLGLDQADDRKIWDYAKNNDFVIVTKDDDFQGIQSLLGYPPKFIHLTLGNCSNPEVLELLIKSADAMENMLSQLEIGFVELY
jgi:predicted nuclease of predicted toxin-antitoxin system